LEQIGDKHWTNETDPNLLAAGRALDVLHPFLLYIPFDFFIFKIKLALTEQF
jgi:hypothetical protein